MRGALIAPFFIVVDTDYFWEGENCPLPLADFSAAFGNDLKNPWWPDAGAEPCHSDFIHHEQTAMLTHCIAVGHARDVVRNQPRLILRLILLLLFPNAAVRLVIGWQ